MMTRLSPSDSVSFFIGRSVFVSSLDVSKLDACPSLLDQLLVKADGLLGDGCPAEDFFDAAASSVTEKPAASGIFEQAVDRCSKIAGKFRGIGGETGDWFLFKLDEKAGFVVDHYLFDASGGAGDHGGPAGHCFEVDDAEGLVNRGAAEHAAVTVKLDGLPPGDHLLDPDDAWMVDARLGNLLAQLGGDFGGVGRPGAEYELDIGRQVADGVDEMGNALLARDAADEEDVRYVEVDSVVREGLGLGGLLVFGKVDAVVDDVDALGIDVRVGAEDVRPGALGDGDDGVGVEDGGALHPGAHGVAAAKLLGFPGAKRLQRMGGEDEGDAVEFFG